MGERETGRRRATVRGGADRRSSLRRAIAEVRGHEKKGLASILTTMRSSCGGQTRRGSGGAADRRRHRVLGLQWRQLGFRGIKAARVRGGVQRRSRRLNRGGWGCLGVQAKPRGGAGRAAAGLRGSRSSQGRRPRQAGPACRWAAGGAASGWAGTRRWAGGVGFLGRGRKKKRGRRGAGPG